MKRDNKNICRILTNLIISSLAFTGVVIPTSAMEQQRELVPTQNKLCEVLTGLNHHEQQNIINIIRAGVRLYNLVVGDPEANTNVGVPNFEEERFYADLKKSVVIDSAGLDGEEYPGIYFGGPIMCSEYDTLLPRVKNYLQSFDKNYRENENYDYNEISNMFIYCYTNISHGCNGASAARNYGTDEDWKIKENPYIGFNLVQSQVPVTTRNADKCPICLEYFNKDDPNQNLVTIPCKHSYHLKCLKGWAKSKRKSEADVFDCPMCKSILKPGNNLMCSNKVIPK